MDWMNTLEQVFNVTLLPLIGTITTALIVFITAKTKELKKKYDNELFHKYADMLEQTIISCVIATNQTYTNSLKEQGKFDEEAQKIAFQKSFDAIMAILSDDAKEYIISTTGDINIYLTQMIEAEVSKNK